MAHELAPRRYSHAGAHQTFLLEFPDPVRIVDVVPVVAIAVGAVDAARKLEGFLRTHHANLQRDIFRHCGGFQSSVVLVFGEVIPDVGMRKVLEQLDSVAPAAEVYKAGLVEGQVQYLQKASILTALQAAVVERQSLVLDRHDYPPRPAQDVDVVGSLLSRPKRVLDDI